MIPTKNLESAIPGVPEKMILQLVRCKLSCLSKALAWMISVLEVSVALVLGFVEPRSSP